MLFWLLIAAALAFIARAWIRTVARRRRWDREHDRYSRRPDLEEAGWSTFVTLLFGPVLIALVLFIASFAGPVTLTSTTALAALRTGSSIEGTFFLGTGSVDEQPVIRYVARAADGAATLEEVNANKARIYEDEADTPRLDTHCRTLDNPWIAPFQLYFGVCSYHFHVPPGSVLQSYEVTP